MGGIAQQGKCMMKKFTYGLKNRKLFTLCLKQSFKESGKKK